MYEFIIELWPYTSLGADETVCVWSQCLGLALEWMMSMKREMQRSTGSCEDKLELTGTS